jgi:Tol biopolymer transport system component
VILGTAAYMSPEQAKGKSVDKQTDVWAFGAVLYEMLTGQAAFQGEDVTEILASVVKASVNLDLLPPSIHPRVREVIIRCLQKEQKKRYSGIADVQYEIEQVLADPSGVFAQPVAVVESRRKLRTILLRAASLALVAIIAGVAVWKLKPTPAPENTITRFLLNLPEADEIPSTEGGVAISPDGTRIVYAAVRNGSRQLYLRNRNRVEPVLISNTERATHPFFSRDGKWIGFFTGSELKKVSLSGGPAQTLSPATYRRGASWGPDNTIVFASDDAPNLMEVSASGGEPQPLTSPEPGERHIFPEFLPNGKAVLFTIIDSGSAPISTAKVAVLSLATGEYHILVDGVDAHFAPSGHLVFGREASLWAAPFDAQRLELAGDPVRVAENIQVNIGGWAHYALATDGTLVYLSGDTLGSGFKRTLVWVDRQGKEELISANPNNYRSPRISPDGTKVALSIEADDNTYDIWIWDLISETMTRLTFNESSGNPLWTLDGQRVAFLSSIEDGEGVYWKAANGTGDDELLVSQPDRTIVPFSWSGDGNALVTFDSFGGNINIGSLSIEGDHSYKPLLKEEYVETQPKISSDGRWMAYSSMESGNAEIYVRPFPDVDKGRWQVSTDGGYDPLWSPDGRELFYFIPDAEDIAVMTVSVETGPTFKAGNPEILFKAPDFGFSVEDFNSWDISPDGKRFLMMKRDESIEGAPRPRINIVLNWFEELKQRVPVD